MKTKELIGKNNSWQCLSLWNSNTTIYISYLKEGFGGKIVLKSNKFFLIK